MVSKSSSKWKSAAEKIKLFLRVRLGSKSRLQGKISKRIREQRLQKKGVRKPTYSNTARKNLQGEIRKGRHLKS